MKNLNKNVPLYLIIHTDSYTGNFERELIGYSIGRLVGCDNHSYRKYISAFWNTECNHEIDSLEMLQDFNEKHRSKIRKETLKNLFDTLINKKGLSKDEAEIRVNKFNERIEKRDFEESLERIYDSVLFYSEQMVDDVTENTFYNITAYSENEDSFNDSIYIQLNNFPDKIEEIFIRRIKEFFELNILKKISDYENLCSGKFYENDLEEIKLLDLELIDKEGNVIKKY